VLHIPFRLVSHFDHPPQSLSGFVGDIIPSGHEDFSEGMIQIVYVSSAARLMSEMELFELLRQARKRNASMDVTGLLMYRSGNFIQALEGPKDAVKLIYRSILADRRHKDCTELERREVRHRSFPGWSMGYPTESEISELFHSNIPGFLSEEMTSKFLKDRSEDILGLLQTLRTSIRP
jgi:hypothetical protein